jgi:hypothetical protein
LQQCGKNEFPRVGALLLWWVAEMGSGAANGRFRPHSALNQPLDRRIDSRTPKPPRPVIRNFSGSAGLRKNLARNQLNVTKSN